MNKILLEKSLKNGTFFAALTITYDIDYMIELTSMYKKDYNQELFIDLFHIKLIEKLNSIIDNKKIPKLENGSIYWLINSDLIKLLRNREYNLKEDLYKLVTEFFVTVNKETLEYNSGHLIYSLVTDENEMMYYPMVEKISDENIEIFDAFRMSIERVETYIRSHYTLYLDLINPIFDEYIIKNPL